MSYFNVKGPVVFTACRNLGSLWLLQTSVFCLQDLSKNRLTDLPQSLGRLTGLQKISLSHNQLSCLPDCLSQLTSKGSSSSLDQERRR